jgi:hypothetical protein
MLAAMHHRAAACIAAVLGTGCSLFLTYPEPCTEGCPEGSSTPGSCTNLRDDDGDGATDAEDAACWNERLAPAVMRCAAVGGIDLAFDRDAFYWVNGRADGSAGLGFTLTPDAGSSGVLGGSNAETTGTLARLELEITPSRDARVAVGLVPLELAPADSVLLPGAEDAMVGVLIDGPLGTLSLVAPGHDGRVSVPISIAPLRVLLSTEEGDITLTVSNGIDAEVVHVPDRTLPVPRSRLVVSSDSQVTLTSLTTDLSTPPLCGYASPLIPASAEDLGASISVARSPDEGGPICAMIVGCSPTDLGWRRSLQVHRFDADGPEGEAWWPQTADLRSTPREPVASAAIVWDDERQQFLAAVVRVDPDTLEGRIDLHTSSDCADWPAFASLEEPVALDSELLDCDPSRDAEPASVGLAVADGNYVLWYAAREARGIVLQHFVVQADNAGAVDRQPPVVLGDTFELPIGFAAVGTRDVALLHRLASDPRSIGLSVLFDGTVTESVMQPLIAPSEEPESFDRYDIPAAGLLFDGLDAMRTTPTVFYAGRGAMTAGSTRPLATVGTAELVLAPIDE